MNYETKSRYKNVLLFAFGVFTEESSSKDTFHWSLDLKC